MSLSALGPLGIRGGESEPLLALAMTLGRDALAAVRAELGATHSRKGVDFALLKNEVEKLTDYFNDLDMDVDAIAFDVDATDEEGWEQMWHAYVEDAGLKGKAPRIRVVRFLKARSESGGAVAAYNGRAKGVVDLLQGKGISLTDATISELERSLVRSEAAPRQVTSKLNRPALK